MRCVAWLIVAYSVLLPLAVPAHAQGGMPVSTPWPTGVALPKATPGVIGPEVGGGTPSTQRKVIGIFYEDRNRKPRLCSGLWISTNQILTAAHCTCHNNDYRVTSDAEMFADGQLNNKAVWRNAKLNQRFPGAVRTICNPFRPYSLGDDLALLTLASPLPTGGGEFACDQYSLYDNIKLGSAWSDSKLRNLTIAGYGFNWDMANSQGRRREALVSINSFTCQNRGWGCVPFAEFIAGGGVDDPRPIDSCGGDSGGPAYVVQGSNFFPVGIVSRGVPLRQPFPQLGQCGAGGIYQHIGRRDVLAWLKRSGVLPGKADCSK